ncbi:hypothetical protein BD289DRAFT_503384 [Coniella lustricola]|uniref:Uncharacterized protein n=1 Tax=Coniella lustricola TaxID=2025994 RepID=A0A2T3AHV7_9PEZI|nr:hypothetical protein BD289DRAFT_503384 [Coniella lustricola]
MRTLPSPIRHLQESPISHHAIKQQLPALEAGSPAFLWNTLPVLFPPAISLDSARNAASQTSNADSENRRVYSL